MPTTNIISFEDALERSEGGKRHLLLGNGFSMALFRDKFGYGSLLEQADFSDMPLARKAFEIMGTSDFEEVIRGLKSTAQLLPLYAQNAEQSAAMLLSDAERLKDKLVQAIAGNHPEFPSEISEMQFLACRQFLAHFCSGHLGNQCGNIYTLNYDLLLYWTLLHTDPLLDGNGELASDDGFRSPDANHDASYVAWDGEFSSNSQNIHYLHGALHLFDSGPELQKFCWERSGGIALIRQIREALDQDKFPLFVAEGDTDGKMTRIQHSGYLQRALKSFSSITKSLFIFGHSLAPNDEHILRKIEKGRVSKLFVSIYGDPDTSVNRAIIRRANLLAANRNHRHPLQVEFYCAESANVWRQTS